MWNREFSQIGSHVALLIGQFIVLIMCIANIEYVYTTHILPDKQAKETFQQTICLLTNEQLRSQDHFIHGYRADFLITYSIQGVQYSRWVSGNGLDISYSQSKSDQEDILSNFNVGENYPCYYNPVHPEVAILVLRHNWLSTFPLMIPSAISLILLYYLVKNLFELMEAVSIKLREMEREKKEKKR